MPSMPSPIDQRRLRDGASALEVSARQPETIDEARQQISTVYDGIAALQSLDDLGADANEFVLVTIRTLRKRMKALKQRLNDLEGKAAKP